MDKEGNAPGYKGRTRLGNNTVNGLVFHVMSQTDSSMKEGRGSRLWLRN